MRDACWPTWYKPGEPCPYGRAIPGEVTIPKDIDFGQAVAVIYSLLPYVVVLLNVVELVVKRGTRQMSFLLYVGLITLSNELVVKRFFHQHRPGANYEPDADYVSGLRNDFGEPVGSCLISCGMPSSHAAMSVGFLVLMICDGVYRVVPSKDELEIGVDKGLKVQCGRECVRVWFTSTPLAPLSLMSHKEFVCFFLVWFVLLVPVPIMRVRIYDHSPDQVLVGSVLGFVCGVGWFVLMQFLTRRWSRSLGHQFCYGIFRHDYRPAEFRVKLSNTRDMVGSVVFKGAEIIMPTDMDLRGSMDLEASVQLQEICKSASCPAYRGQPDPDPPSDGYTDRRTVG